MINVFGGNGFIGSRFCELYPNVIKNERNDYTIKESNEILYFISTTNNYNIYNDPYLDIDTNLTTLIKVLESCKNKKVTFNFISSWFVYGDSITRKDELGKCNPKGFYSITKRTAEQLLIEYCETFNIKYRILRLCNVLGLNDKFSEQKNVLQSCIAKLKNNEPIYLSNGGNFERDYLFVDDVCKAINLIIKKGKTDTIYNVCSGISYAFRDILLECKKLTNSSSEFIDTPLTNAQLLVHINNIFLDNSKIDNLGFKPSINLNEGLKLLCQ